MSHKVKKKKRKTLNKAFHYKVCVHKPITLATQAATAKGKKGAKDDKQVTSL